MNNNIAIYTCITGDYEMPTDGFVKKPGYDYYCFCDRIIPVTSWQLMIPKFSSDVQLTNVKRQRLIKTHPFDVLPNYDIVVWIDANTKIDSKLYKYIAKHKDSPIVFKKHPERDCVYDEMKECVFWGKETPNNGQFLFQQYKKAKYPIHNGLYETNIILSHPQDKTVQKIFNLWWEQIYRYSHRDQLSLNLVLWKNKLEEYVKVVKTNDFPPQPHQHIESKDSKRFANVIDKTK